MNIFFLALTPRDVARSYCDKHVYEEPAHLLRLLNFTYDASHPCMVWVRASKANYYWVAMLSIELCKEYLRRQKRVHPYAAQLEPFLRTTPDLPNVGVTQPPIVVTSDCLIAGELVDSYRQYYRVHKSAVARWTRPAEVPEWFCPAERRHIYQRQ